MGSEMCIRDRDRVANKSDVLRVVARPPFFIAGNEHGHRGAQRRNLGIALCCSQYSGASLNVAQVTIYLHDGQRPISQSVRPSFFHQVGKQAISLATN